jgi:hypothetical protein
MAIRATAEFLTTAPPKMLDLDEGCTIRINLILERASIVVTA